MAIPQSTDHVLLDIVEPVNRYLHIPISSKIVDRLKKTSITPNQVTYISVALGILSGWAFAQGTFAGMFIGGVCLEFSLIFDCVDGQLARATGQSSEWGRLLDGIGGYIAYLAVVWGVWIAFPDHSLALTVITIFSILKAISFDYCKQYFTAKVQEGKDGARREIFNAYGRWNENSVFILKVYFYYLQFQQWIFHGHCTSLQAYDEEGERRAVGRVLTESQRESFCESIRPLILLWRWNGHEVCLFLLALFALFGLLNLILEPLAVVMTIQFILTLILHRYLIPKETVDESPEVDN